eukprot:738494-Amphidinium_carterae.1
MLLSRQTACIIIEVPTLKLSPLVSPSLRARELETETVEREVKLSLKPARSRVAKGMGDREFGFDEEKFFSAQLRKSVDVESQ